MFSSIPKVYFCLWKGNLTLTYCDFWKKLIFIIAVRSTVHDCTIIGKIKWKTLSDFLFFSKYFFFKLSYTAQKQILTTLVLIHDTLSICDQLVRLKRHKNMWRRKRTSLTTTITGLGVVCTIYYLWVQAWTSRALDIHGLHTPVEDKILCMKAGGTQT